MDGQILISFAGALGIGARVAAIGCGAPVARFLSDRGLDVTVIAFSARGAALAHAAQPALPFVAANPAALAFGDGVFDGALAAGAFSETRPRTALARFGAELARITRKGGRLLATAEEDSFSRQELSLLVARSGFVVAGSLVRTPRTYVLAERT